MAKIIITQKFANLYICSQKNFVTRIARQRQRPITQNVRLPKYSLNEMFLSRKIICYLKQFAPSASYSEYIERNEKLKNAKIFWSFPRDPIQVRKSC